MNGRHHILLFIISLFLSYGGNVLGMYFTHNIRLGWCYFTIGISLQHQHNVILDIKGEYELRTLKGVVTTYPGWITPSHCKKDSSDLIWSSLMAIWSQWWNTLNCTVSSSCLNLKPQNSFNWTLEHLYIIRNIDTLWVV